MSIMNNYFTIKKKKKNESRKTHLTSKTRIQDGRVATPHNMRTS